MQEKCEKYKERLYDDYEANKQATEAYSVSWYFKNMFGNFQFIDDIVQQEHNSNIYMVQSTKGFIFKLD